MAGSMARRLLEFAIRLALELEGLVAFEVTNELLRRQDRSQLDVAVFLNDIESLAGLEVERLPNPLWNNDWIFG